MESLNQDILQTLWYYDIWCHPLTVDELYAFLPTRWLGLEDFRQHLERCGPGDQVLSANRFYFLKHRGEHIVADRKKKEQRARLMWRFARIATHVIKRFPFVRAVFVSGELSKNVASKGGDIDFFIVTAPNRLWIVRALLTLFKKIFLLDSKKFFCLNYFVSTDHLVCSERNLYAAAEVAHVKVLYNSRVYAEFLGQNPWIREYFPNFEPTLLPTPKVNNRRSFLQVLLELAFAVVPADYLDTFLLWQYERLWARRYPECDPATRQRLFRSTKSESRAHPTDYQRQVLHAYGSVQTMIPLGPPAAGGEVRVA